ncbi:hypothetical protein LSH36_93g07059 [Paralvinella palmiformis]|uniref:Uncharacterized protein n=1 Tax=Paralvinella palmiformis TaxID=53620 RepID=A0AAD9NAB1_9ANNE|nr:hypothetical protein LSH36_93g07059 [Paralvinella palmiformis]
MCRLLYHNVCHILFVMFNIEIILLNIHDIILSISMPLLSCCSVIQRNLMTSCQERIIWKLLKTFLAKKTLVLKWLLELMNFRRNLYFKRDEEYFL